MIVLWIAVLASVLLGVLLTGMVRRYALARALLDVPNERSSHTVATPRGGGVSIVACYAVGAPVLWVLGLIEGHVAMALLGALAIAAAGWWDDHVDLSPLTRLLVQLAAAAWTVAWLHGFPTLSLGGSTVGLGVWGSALAVVTLVWLANLYNFMDGIDGIAGSEAVVAGTAIAAVLWWVGAPGLAVASAILAASSLGFLVWNWPPAKIFMGDVGSGTLGFAFGAIALAAERTVGTPALVLLVPLGAFIADTMYTLVRRTMRGERVYVAHRSHVYQRLVQLGWGHARVTTSVVVLTLVLSVLAALALRHPADQTSIIVGAVAVLVVVGWALMRVARRGTRPEPDSELTAVVEVEAGSQP